MLDWLDGSPQLTDRSDVMSIASEKIVIQWADDERLIRGIQWHSHR